MTCGKSTKNYARKVKTLDGRRLILNDGTTLERGEAGFAEGFLWCYIPNFTMQQAASLFFDASKTSRIEFDYGDMKDTYEGYTTCTRLLDEGDRVSVCMVRGSNYA